jgi:pyrroloquinoline-quinone synthase
VDRGEFQEALLSVMDGKQHWAWPAFTSGAVSRDLLHLHFEQEWEVYVRDFPRFLGRAHGQCPVPEVRRELAENLYEEETGALTLRRPHAELFLLYPRGLGMDLGRFDRVALLPAAARLRGFLDWQTGHGGWERATALATIFLEGTSYERGEIEEGAPRRPEPPLSEHPLVRHYGLDLEALALTRAHRQVEGSHRRAAWNMVLDHVEEEARGAVVATMKEALELWLRYRDAVARACGVEPSPGGD